MKKTIGFCEFCDTFRDMDRNDNFSYDGKRALWEYLGEYEDATGEEIELDIIALCCEYSEYESLGDFRKEYSEDFKTIEDIEERTCVIPIEGKEGFIIQQF